MEQGLVRLCIGRSLVRLCMGRKFGPVVGGNTPNSFDLFGNGGNNLLSIDHMLASANGIEHLVNYSPYH